MRLFGYKLTATAMIGIAIIIAFIILAVFAEFIAPLSLTPPKVE